MKTNFKVTLFSVFCITAVCVIAFLRAVLSLPHVFVKWATETLETIAGLLSDAIEFIETADLRYAESHENDE